MNRHRRIILALSILLSGLLLLPQINLYAGPVTWQRFAGGYEDTVTVTRADYVTSAQGGGTLIVHATNTAGNQATLTVYRTADNLLIGNLTWTGTDHRGQFPLPTNPMMITVRSSLGGETTAPVEEVPTAVEVASLDAGNGDRTVIAVLALAAIAGLAALVAARKRG